MRLCKFKDPGKGERFGIVKDETVYDITDYNPEMRSLSVLLHNHRIIKLLEETLKDISETEKISLSYLDREPDSLYPYLLPPIDNQEVWAAGVTYKRSKEARIRESRNEDFYTKVYSASRPELFFKATPNRTVGPNAPIHIRNDSKWSVPEPELALIISLDMRLVGYTIGNDVSARDIEGENPLYLPQAKVFTGCCALGPVITLANTLPDPYSLNISMTIRRDGKAIFFGETSTGNIKRNFEDLISYLGRENTFPNGVVLLTGTGIVPPDDFTLKIGDVVEINILDIGTLRNHVA